MATFGNTIPFTCPVCKDVLHIPVYTKVRKTSAYDVFVDVLPDTKVAVEHLKTHLQEN